MARFPLFSESSKSSGDAQKSPVATSPQPELTRIDLGFGQPTICSKYPYGDLLDGLLSYGGGPQISGRMMLPLLLTFDEGPIYVNAKHYHGILRRRKSHTKSEGENKATRGQNPYMHVSRHLHAMRCPGGSSGRFLNTVDLNNVEREAGMKKDCVAAILQPTVSSSSGVLQSNSGTSNSQNKANGSVGITSGSEVTRVFTRLDLDHFSINHQRPPPIYSFPCLTEKTARSIIMLSKCVAAADNRRNPKF